MTESALVLFSGGQDSAICLAWALDRYTRVGTVGFDYGQVHRTELTARVVLRNRLVELEPRWKTRLGDDHIVPLAGLATLAPSELLGVGEVKQLDGLPSTFVPGRNLLFLLYASILGYRLRSRRLVCGACETDFSGYPDCRDDTIKALQIATNLGLQSAFVFDTPLMHLTKAQSWRLAETIGGQALVDLILEESHTCYRGVRSVRYDWGYGCGECPACQIRARGYHEFVGST